MARPLGVTILGVLAILGGIASLCLGGLVALGSTALSGNISTATHGISTVNSGTLAAIGGFTAVLGVLEIVFGVGFLQLKGWAWMLGIVLQAISVVFGIAQIATGSSTFLNQALGLVISLVILFYLFTPQVRAAFGRG
jgi:uncharacterized membrane protein (DUF2068 family)